MSTAERRRDMLYLLSAKRQDTITNLAKEYDVSWLTAQRDIEILSQEYPIYTTTGPKGGVFVVDGFYASNTYLSREQEKLLRKMQLAACNKNKQLIQGILNKFAMPANKMEEKHEN